jgi:hypothetical protein
MMMVTRRLPRNRAHLDSIGLSAARFERRQATLNTKKKWSVVMKSVIRLYIVASLIVAIMVQGTFLAQVQAGVRDAGSKIRGDYLTSHRSASRNMRNSRTTSRDLRTFARRNQRNNQAPTPAIARAHAEELGQEIKLTQKYLAEERKIAQAQNDKEILTKLDKVDTLVAQEAEAQAKLLKECSGEKVDAVAAVDCCEKCEDALDKAMELHDEIVVGLEEAN